MVGIIMPAIIEFVNKRIGTNKRKLKYMVAFGSCIAIGIATTILVDGISLLDPKDFLGNIGLVFAASQTAYNTYWKGSELQKKIP